MKTHTPHFIRGNQSGFTLIEVLIAVSVFTIGILGANVMQLGAIKGNVTANGITQATNWAADRIEILSGLDYLHTELRDDDADGTAGLNDAQCCSDGNDPNGNPVTGCTQKADGCAAQDQYAIYWNVAEDPTSYMDIKNINFIVNRLDRGVTKAVIVSYKMSNSL